MLADLDPLALVAGLGFGLSLIVAIGAQNAFVLRQGLLRSHVPAVVAVCAVSDIVLIALGIGGVGVAFQQLPWLMVVARVGGAAFLLAYAVFAARRALRPVALTLAADPDTAPAAATDVATATVTATTSATDIATSTVTTPATTNASTDIATPTTPTPATATDIATATVTTDAATPADTATAPPTGPITASAQPTGDLRPHTTTSATAAPASPTRSTRASGGLLAAVLTCLALTWLNPHVYLDTVVLLGSVANTHGDSRWLFGIGAAVASVVWFTALGYGARFLRPLFARPAAWRVLDGIIAVMMAAIAVSLLLGL